MVDKSNPVRSWALTCIYMFLGNTETMSGYLFVYEILLVSSHFPGKTDFKMQHVQNFQVITEKLQT